MVRILKIYFDARWIGDHGIGRFARVVGEKLQLEPIEISGSPSSPLDPVRFFLAIFLKTIKKSLIFSPGFNAPLFFIRKFVFVIHDLNHIDRPENSSFLKRLYYEIIMKRGCRKAFKVLTVSEFSRRRIADWACIDINKIINVGNGVDPSYCLTAIPYSPGYTYLLCVSNRKEHKNEQRILEAFSDAEIDPAIRLIFTGSENSQMASLCEKLKIQEKVIFLGRVAELDLPGLYCGALALIFPSLYEGFGLPVIEAMACGVPVLTSNTTCLPEIAGNAAILVDPMNVKEITAGISRLCSDLNLRNELRAKGIEQAGHFSWDKTVQKVASVFESAKDD
ncbi:mannosyl transferase [Janthinobacterium sp. BJB312]|nr:mannosyl transferase [Janthinobacterium sp. BJB312]